MPYSPEALEAAQLIERLERLARNGEQTHRLNPAQWDALRYLTRANRFSRTPAALADYLASTRGTVSRTLIALEEKGYLTRRPSARDGRSVALALTGKAKAALSRDPLLAMAETIQQASGDDIEAFLDGLKRTLRAALARNGGRAFGICHSCRHFRVHARPSTATPHHCALLDAPLSKADSQEICVEQEPVAA